MLELIAAELELELIALELELVTLELDATELAALELDATELAILELDRLLAATELAGLLELPPPPPQAEIAKLKATKDMRLMLRIVTPLNYVNA